MNVSEAHVRYIASLRNGETARRQALQDLEQAEKANRALIMGRLVHLGLEGEDVDAAVESASDVWREAFESLREAYCLLWSVAQETDETDSPVLQAVEFSLLALLDLCRDSARRLDEQGD